MSKPAGEIVDRLSLAQREILGRFGLGPRVAPLHGRSGYLALQYKGLLEWAGEDAMRLTPLGIEVRRILQETPDAQ